jgi:hypothetical protein
MKNLTFTLKTLGLVTVLAMFVGAVQAQNREKFGISAKAGGVNSVTGNVRVTRAGQEAQLLSGQDDLNAGDKVTTGYASQTEVLLNPGSYLRLGENSELVLVDNSLNNLVVKLVKGSAIIEATGGDDVDLRINVLTNHKQLVIVRGGIYRINTQPGFTELLVRKGRVWPDSNPLEVVKGGKKVTYTGGAPVIAKLEKKDQDDFDLWSKNRAETLAKANARLSNRTVNGYLSSMTPAEWAFSAATSFGVWAYSSASRGYTFVPFHYGWSSPYGNFYGSYCNVTPYGNYGYGNNNGTVVRGGGLPGGGSSNGYPGGPSSGGSSSGGSSGGNVGGMGGSSGGSSVAPMPSTPSTSMGSQAGPRDPDSGGRSLNRVKDPK